jgi:hypothetical protein
MNTTNPVLMGPATMSKVEEGHMGKGFVKTIITGADQAIVLALKSLQIQLMNAL